MELITLPCPECGQKFLISNPAEGKTMKCGCGAQLMLHHTAENPVNPHESKLSGSPSPDITQFLIGALVGFFGGALVWTATGRLLTTTAIAKGAAVTREKVEEWVKKGEE